MTRTCGGSSSVRQGLQSGSSQGRGSPRGRSGGMRGAGKVGLPGGDRPQQCEMAVGGMSEVSRPRNFARQQGRRCLTHKRKFHLP